MFRILHVLTNSYYRVQILKKICDHPFLLTKRAAEEVMDGMESLQNKDDIGMVEDMATNLLNMTLRGESQHLDHTVSSKLCFLMTLLVSPTFCFHFTKFVGILN